MRPQVGRKVAWEKKRTIYRAKFPNKKCLTEEETKQEKINKGLLEKLKNRNYKRSKRLVSENIE